MLAFAKVRGVGASLDLINFMWRCSDSSHHHHHVVEPSPIEGIQTSGVHECNPTKPETSQMPMGVGCKSPATYPKLNLDIDGK
jgi:hypothetical protein